MGHIIKMEVLEVVNMDKMVMDLEQVVVDQLVLEDMVDHIMLMVKVDINILEVMEVTHTEQVVVGVGMVEVEVDIIKAEVEEDQVYLQTLQGLL